MNAPRWGPLLPMVCFRATSPLAPVIPQSPVEQAWPLMTPAERPPIWAEAWLARPHNAEEVIAPIERNRDEADCEGPLYH